ncbi:30S ribosomal protein S4 [Candidatus Berkelbacteria bacterium]|nr:30S ribosomal protein S4 [Candidatus Berkelbacteria bacterium]
MARYLGPRDRISRRIGTNLFLKGERSYGPKNPMTRRAYAPGQHGNKRRGGGKISEYGRQLKEKQKAKAIYGILERQFRRYYDAATRAKSITGERLIQLLECRLDNVVFRLGLADSRPQARQYVGHGHVRLNGKKVTIPSHQVAPGDTVELVHVTREPSALDVPLWMERTGKKALAGTFLDVPSRDQIPTEIEEQLIVEFYSR